MKAILAMVAAASLASSAARPDQSRPSAKSRARQRCSPHASPEHEVMIVSTGRQTRVRVPPTTDRKKLKDASAGLFPTAAPRC